MSFLDNSGDIIIDAVLTDTGRQRLARGDNSFRPVKFALFDDEIDYSMYDSAHPSGSAFYDLEILQTPVFEAFTNNTSIGHSKLLSIARDDLLYIPVLKLSEIDNGTARHADGVFVVAVDDDTETDLITPTSVGIFKGSSAPVNSYIRVDEGLDTSDINPSSKLDPDLVERQYAVQIDNRLGRIVSTDSVIANLSFIDDDNVATYIVGLSTDPRFVRRNSNTAIQGEAIAGPRGTILELSIKASIDLQSSEALFNKFGTTATIDTVNTKIIDSVIKIEGLTTGARIDIPVRFAKSI